MCAAERTAHASRAGAARTDYGAIVVCGGGCYGEYYVRQLRRAAARGVIRWRDLVVVDRDPRCRVATGADTDAGDAIRSAPALRVVVEAWDSFFDDYLGRAAARPLESALDAIVPSPLMPHLMYEWLQRRARARWPGRLVEARPLPAPPRTPWERAGADGTHYASFATWLCPVNCVEPARCPHTRGPRDWSMPDAARAWVAERRAAGDQLAGPAIFHCVHRAFGVGMFDTAEALAADALVAEAGTGGAANVLVGTVSHCHGAFGLLHLGPTRPSALPVEAGRGEI
ncbi:MAG TPA: hypothetical protein VFZ11_06620 [Gemmatimonadaceae bacterium]